MDDTPRKCLCELVSKDRSIIDDPRKLRALLLDYCGQHRPEINAIINAQAERIPQELLMRSGQGSDEALLFRLSKRLYDDMCMREEAARWAVETWATALGIAAKTESRALEKRPQPLARRQKDQLHFIWIVDCSGSMARHGKMQAINDAIRDYIPELQEAARDNPDAELLVRCVAYSTGARWAIKNPTPVNGLKWQDLSADGAKDMGAALSMVAKELTMEKLGTRGLRPVLVLIADSTVTDDFKKGLNELFSQEWGREAVRIGIPIGDDAYAGHLEKFTGDLDQILNSDDSLSIVSFIDWQAIELG